PYVRVNSRRGDTERRRKMWNHALEKRIFTSDELLNMTAPARRTIYKASVEAHIDQLHEQLQQSGISPVCLNTLEAYQGLNSKLARSMIAGLQHDIANVRFEILQLDQQV
ncbi:hypothetical protein C8Q76DRAFT_590384, partial [Earliella scabrosa]